MGTAGCRDGSTGEPVTAEDVVAAATPAGSARRWSPSRAACLTFAIGLVVTAALALTSLGLYNRNEDRLLGLRARQLGLVLTTAVTSIQTPLASAAELADATGGSPQKFHAFIDSYVGPGRQFASVSLWPLGTSRLAPVVVAGSTPALVALPAQTRTLLRAANTRTC
jgi:hypothetical protein